MNKDLPHLPWARCVNTVVFICLATALSSVALCDAPASSAPLEWFVAGDNNVQASREYSGVLDRTVAYEGSGSGLLKSESSTAQSGTLMQTAAAGIYRGKKVKLKAFLRSRDVARRAGLWIRADNAEGFVVAFRNCFSPKATHSYVRDNTDWTETEISLDIPDTAASLSYGVQMSGTGSVWIDSVTLEVLGAYETADGEYLPTPRLHNSIGSRNLTAPPRNLDFEE